MIAVDNYITRRPIDETSANLLSLVATEMAKVLVNVALRESLAQSEAKYRSLVENAGAGVAIADLKGRLVFVNKAVCRMTGYSKDELIGIPLVDFLHPDDKKKILRLFSKSFRRSGKELHLEFRIIHEKGHVIHCYSCPTIFMYKGKTVGFNAIISDITERKLAEEQVKASLAEKEVLLKEIHHRVKNNLQVISSLLNLQSDYTKDDQALQMFRESQSRVRSMALIHEKLYQSRDLARVDFAEYIRDLANYLFRTYGTNSRGIRLGIKAHDVSLDIDTAIPCGLIINELVSNSLKHGFPADEAYDEQSKSNGEIDIELRSDNSGKLTLIVSDNGVGLPRDLDFRKTESLGLQLVNTLTEQLEGVIELDRRDGTVFKITFQTFFSEKKV